MHVKIFIKLKDRESYNKKENLFFFVKSRTRDNNNPASKEKKHVKEQNIKKGMKAGTGKWFSIKNKIAM